MRFYLPLTLSLLCATKAFCTFLPAGVLTMLTLTPEDTAMRVASVLEGGEDAFQPSEAPWFSYHSPAATRVEAAAAAQECGNPLSLTPFYELWHPDRADSFYTTDAQERQTAISSGGYTDDGLAGYIWPANKPQPGTIPLYRLWNSEVFNHFYTSSNLSKANAQSIFGYKDEGIAGYVYPDGICGGVPLYALQSSVVVNNFYTTSTATRDNAVKNNKDKYTYEGVGSWIVPNFN